MKKLFLFFMLVTATISCFSQDEPKNVVKANPLGLIFGNANISYERALGNHSSIVFAPSFGFLKLNDLKYSTFGLGAEYRFYLSGSKMAPKGTYVAPGVSFQFGKVKSDVSETNLTGFGGKAVIGRQWVFESGFTLDLQGGIQYTSFSFEGDIGASAFKGVLPTLGLGLGYAW